ncbi:uncharacterized protein CcaverHIS019_0113150 [Cutaneotrichosporon cavernicola]|uniref:Uncharacterized protein n=1 Tax=Cutaneotrichosporon cavernicola TaxID=279322 RepID=A0AA48L1A9_9TREE|nr:uncharacterized protein CcaverHIS019_0113150 [Cutaneotrichosporon cavernicola]BEI88597.1 hypothetical protein CcaverHIS019_0113150 [Cutaneotrichosporon cavernicola]
MSSLDAGMYPHLISLIVDLASHESLIYLRATCRAFRIHADMNLNAGRLIVTPVAAGEQRVVVSSECGRIPAFAGWALSPPPPNIDELATPSHDDEEPAHHGPNDDDSVKCVTEESRKSGAAPGPIPKEMDMPYGPVPNLRFTTAIDLLGAIGREYTRRLVTSYPIGGKAYLRVVDPHQLPPRIPWNICIGDMSLVKFITLPDMMIADRMIPSKRALEVLNIAYHPRDNYTASYLRESKGSDALSSVFIFHHASKPCLGAAPEDELDFTSLVMYSEDDMLDIVFSGIASSLVDGMKVTVVGVDVIAESRWLKNMDENLVGVDDRHNLRVLVWLQCFQPGRWSLIDHGHWPNLEFKTMDEFLASVPVSRDAALETTREGRL